MNLRKIFCGMALAMALSFPPDPAFAQESSKGGEKAPAISPEMMKRWEEAATPGEAHKLLNHLVGKWEVTSRMWFEGPGKPPIESKSASESKWIMDGRFVQEEATAQMMGQIHKSLNIIGYDNIKKKYVTSHIENMGTSIYTAEGTLDQTGKVMTMFGKFDDPATGERDKLLKFVTRLIGPDKYVFEMYDMVGTPDEFKSMEMTYVRKR